MKSDKKKILIVEDEPSIQTLLDYNLKQANYETILVADGEDAVHKATSGKTRFNST